MQYINDLDLQRAKHLEVIRVRLVAGILSMCGISVIAICLLLLK